MTRNHYQIVPLSLPLETPESRGSRIKFWVRVTSMDKPWLLKFPRPITGEHWAEKIVAEVGHLIGIPCANVELVRPDWQPTLAELPARWQPAGAFSLGTICESFLPDKGRHGPTGEKHHYYYHGSEILQVIFEGYNAMLKFHQREHNIKNIVTAMAKLMDIGSYNPMPFWDEELKTLASYALLDGIVGNTDRHHDNWMVAVLYDGGDVRIEILPSFDHASSLGRELTDDRREDILASNGMLGYIRRGRGGVFVNSRGRRALPPLRLARLLCRWAPEFTREACERIAGTPEVRFEGVVDRIPREFMSPTAKRFAVEVMLTSRAELLRSLR